MPNQTTEAFVVAGAGGYACELVVACRTVGRQPVCLLDDGHPDQARIAATGMELRGTVDEAAHWAPMFLVGIGYPEPRQAVTERLLRLGLMPAAAVVHPAATLMGADPVPAGTVVFPHSTVSRGVSLGAHVLINYNTTVGHDATIGHYTTISPGAQIGGECEIGRGVLVGSGAVVLQGVRIGDGAIVGSGSVVTKDVKSGELVIGVPARPR